jgi:hypothetical protein
MIWLRCHQPLKVYEKIISDTVAKLFKYQRLM